MRADLHIHSVYSDGACTPAALAEACRRNGVMLASLTDHDNFAGDGEKRAAFAAAGVKYLTGVEISAYEGKTKVHITGYGYDAAAPQCLAAQRERERAAYARLDDVLERLQRYKHISLSAADVLSVREKDVPPHTFHIASALVKKGFYPSVRDAFCDCFRPGLPTYSFVGRPTPFDAVQTIHALGGVACLAHPGRIFLPAAERERLIFALRESGLDGIECNYPTHTVGETAYYRALCARLGLLETGGSDFHREGGGRTIGEPFFEPDDAFLRAVRLSA